jgi:hypothetical protein
VRIPTKWANLLPSGPKSTKVKVFLRGSKIPIELNYQPRHQRLAIPLKWYHENKVKEGDYVSVKPAGGAYKLGIVRSARHPKQREAKLSEKVAEYIERKFHCQTTRELKFPGCTFDVVGFNPTAEEFYVVETKLGHKPADVGHALGQVLAYEAVISQRGRDFMSRVFDKLRLPFEITSRVGNEKTIKVHRFIALMDKACSDYQLIKNLRKELSAPVGVIRYDGRCRDYLMIDGGKDHDVCRSKAIPIGVLRHYNRVEFFDELSRRLLKRYENLTPSKHPQGNPRYLQLRFGHSGFHLEAHATKKVATLSLDAELNSRKRAQAFFKSTRRANRQLRRQIRGLRVKENWANGGKWGRIVLNEEEPIYDEALVKKSVDVLAKMYYRLKPKIDEFVRT